MPTKMERLLFLRKKLTEDLKRLHARIQICTDENDTGTLVSYRNALENCWSKYENNNDSIENSKDNPCNEDYITETGILNDLYLEAQGKLLHITPNNALHESLALFKPPEVAKKRVLPKRKLSSITEELPTHSSNLSESNKSKQDNNSNNVDWIENDTEDNANHSESESDGNYAYLHEQTGKFVRRNSQRSTSTPLKNGNSGIYPTLSLPPLKMKVFSGDKLEWPEFKATCEVTFSNMDPTNRFRYLKSQLEGEAARLVKHLPIIQTSYDLAWDILERRYDNQRAIINANLARLIDLPNILRESAQSLKTLVDTTNECTAALHGFNIDISTWNSILIFILSRKLDSNSVKHWEEHIMGMKTIPPLQSFLGFLDIRINILETTNEHDQPNNPKNKPKIMLATDKMGFKPTVKAIKCVFCSEDHRSYTCPQFLSKTVPDRKIIVQTLKLCSNCLFPHSVDGCTSKFSCRICGQRHHSLLHEESGPIASTSMVFNGNACNPKYQVMLATAMVRISHNNKSMLFKALIDQGSMANLITKRASDALQLPLHQVNVPITGVGGSVTCRVRKRTKFVLQPHFEAGESLQLDALVMPKITTLNLVSQDKNWKHLDNIQLADPHLDKNGRIDILIGAETFSEILLNGVLKGECLQPIAQNTRLGWILSGKVDSGNTPIIPIMSVVISNESLNKSIKQFWESEEIPSEIVENTPDEKLAEQIYVETTKRCEDGRYMVKLPFKSNPIESIGESLHIASQRLFKSQAMLNKKPELKIKYDKCIQEYLDLNQMELVDMNQKPHYYCPHHAVIRESSTTTQVRTVFDCSCKTSNGNSLNSELLVGPTIQPDLFSLLIHWRKFKYAITGDIEKMYRQIWVYPEDTNYQRILWQPPNSQTVNSYRLKTVTFGVASAPFLAIRTLHQIGEDIKSEFPDLAQKIQKQFYVDDFLDSCPTIHEAKQVVVDSTNQMLKFGMKLRKWKSNSASILDSISSAEKEIEENQTCTFKTLGIQWQPSSDMFVFLPMELNKEIGLSKRSILSDISKLFDPLGWLSPCIILAKIFIQTLWLLKLDWDDKIPDKEVSEWLKIRNQFHNSCSMKVPRWIGLSDDIKHISLQGFSDASEKAYACVIYMRIVRVDGSILCNLIAAKTKVAPLKQISIPRLELNGTVLLIKLMHKIKNALRMPTIQQTAWTDSSIVLYWLSGQPNRWKTYVANRVSKIQNQFPSNNWRHVGSKQNPADCASRGLIREELEEFDLWWKGPEFLSQDEIFWPKTEFKSTNLEERKVKAIVNTVQITHKSFIPRFSSYSRMLGVAKYCFKWLSFIKSKSVITENDLNDTENRLIRIVQSESFHEMRTLECRKEIDSKSSIKNLDPFLDKKGIMRVGGRLQQSSFSENEKHPIILPSKHHFTRILIQHEHLLQKHGGLAIVLQKLRQKFWIVNAKVTVNSVIHRCISCFRYKKKLLCQKMGSIPAYRLSENIPFTFTGVDYAGYFNIKSSQRKNAPFIKGYISLFICLTTRAIHLELVSDLSAEQFLKAFKRFVGRRGIPSEMHSDNGTNFIKAAKMLNDMFDTSITQNLEINEQFVSWLNSNRIQWKNIPPHAPHFGGWESGVKLVKHHLKRVLGDTRLTFEDFNTLLVEIEAIVNSRPLWSIPTKTDEYEPLTPGHFLIFRALNTLPEPNLSHLAVNRLNQYQYLCRLVSDFWKLWHKEYCHQLQIRKKWKQTEPNIKPNQMVFIIEDNETPTQWLLGRILNVVEGQDGLVRVANIQVTCTDDKNGIRRTKTIQRSIHRLSLLPIVDNTS